MLPPRPFAARACSTEYDVAECNCPESATKRKFPGYFCRRNEAENHIAWRWPTRSRARLSNRDPDLPGTMALPDQYRRGGFFDSRCPTTNERPLVQAAVSKPP